MSWHLVTYIHTYIYINLYTYIQTCADWKSRHVLASRDLHASIHTHIHTYIRIHMYTYTYMCRLEVASWCDHFLASHGLHMNNIRAYAACLLAAVCACLCVCVDVCHYQRVCTREYVSTCGMWCVFMYTYVPMCMYVCVCE